jgi:predicted aldo/keto reductase-like oxidoreductase
MPRERGRFFLGCKTMERTRAGAWEEMQRSLKLLQTDQFDLYQLHAITSMEDLDACTMAGGALDALIEARAQGLIRHIGITGHGINSPAIYIEALNRFDFDSVLFPLNFVQMSIPEFRSSAEALIATCKAKDVGTMVIKTTTKGPWGEKQKTATTWYEPFDQMEIIQQAVNFALSYEVTGLCTAGDIKVLPMVLKACQNFSPLNQLEREGMIQSGQQFEPLFI